ncbi:3-keto-disaccharide hydrolase [Maribacter halichondriae]|uniref:3-keto-disaccharide hydrolase n=1 Tax=Maribacter halichondriae TaxID=2980554 RepID=UPI002358DE4E|nr:DUF1080 domain-containing protein [Maribacter sp. Hal144]
MKNKPWKILVLGCLICVIASCREKIDEKTSETIEEEIQSNDGFASIFDGNSLENWNGDTTYWRAENDVLVGEITPETLLENNTFIIYESDEPADFELKAEFRISKDGNSGINYRSEQLDTIPFALRGYQADIDGNHRYTGQNYEERKRTTLAYRGEKAEIASPENPDVPGSLEANVERNAWKNREVLESLGHMDSLKTKINSSDWNKIHLIVKGNRMQHYVNGILMSEVIDNDSINRKASGKLGMQVHVGPPMKVEYRNIMLKKL